MDARSLVTSFAQDNPTVPALQFIRDDTEGVHISLIAEGYINYVFRVQSCDQNESIIIKHAESYFKGAPEVTLSIKRQQLEYDCMLLMDTIQRDSVPTPYCLDTTHNIIAMRDLIGGEWELLFDQVYMKKDIDLWAAAHLGQTLGTLHTLTSRNNTTQQEWEQLKARFKHDDLKEPLLDLHHRDHYDEHNPTIMSHIPEEYLPSYRALVNDIKQQGLDIKVVDTFQDEVCVVHADLHQRNIFVRDGKTTLIDFEFGFLGHPAVNLGLPIQGYVFTYIVDEAHQAQSQTRNGYTLKAKCKQAIRTMMEAYLEFRTDLGNDKGEVKEFFSALALLTGSFLFFVGSCGFNTMSGPVGMCCSDRGPLMIHGHKLMMNHEDVATLDDFMDLL